MRSPSRKSTSRRRIQSPPLRLLFAALTQTPNPKLSHPQFSIPPFQQPSPMRRQTAGDFAPFPCVSWLGTNSQFKTPQFPSPKNACQSWNAQTFFFAVSKAKIRPCLHLAQFCRFLQCVNPNSDFSKLEFSNLLTRQLSKPSFPFSRPQPQAQPSLSKARDSHSFEVNGLGEACALGFSFHFLSAVENWQGRVSVLFWHS